MSAGGTASYGNDVIDGGTGTDTIDFLGALALGPILVDLSRGIGNGTGNNFTISNVENVLGGNGPDHFTGNGAANLLIGQGGDDTLGGAAGNDTLTGGAGIDFFFYADPAGAANADRITDFVAGSEELLFDLTDLPALGSRGAWAAGDARFNSGAGFTSARDSSDRLVYDTNTGNLYYDADGLGGGSGQLVFTLQGIPGLSASDITVI
jgi:Ca2+-binding RTX toxin-like protein